MSRESEKFTYFRFIRTLVIKCKKEGVLLLPKIRQTFSKMTTLVRFLAIDVCLDKI